MMRASWRSSLSLLGASREPLELSGGQLGPNWSHPGLFWAVLEAFWVYFGCLGGVLEAILFHLGRIESVLGGEGGGA
eukprot:4920173-Pyramimonas_sp.AAC.1